MAAVFPTIDDSLPSIEKLDIIWTHCIEGEASKNTSTDNSKTWPSYNEVLQDVRHADYNDMLTCPLDLHRTQELQKTGGLFSRKKKEEPTAPIHMREKKICSQGAVCQAKLELFDFPESMDSSSQAYTGVLKPAVTHEHCLVRLSSALQPPTDSSGESSRLAKMMLGNKLANAQLFPAVAIKILRSGLPSANILCLGSKVGQQEPSFFAHCLSTQITPKMPATFKPILKIFKRYSDYPLGLGLSDVCREYEDNGIAASSEPNFPFCLTLKPVVEAAVASTAGQAQSHDTFLGEIMQVPTNSTIYELFASPDPDTVGDARKLQRIGRLVTTSAFMSSPSSDGLFFRHQKKDEDFDLRPAWKDALQGKVQMADGTIGTVEEHAGWKLFEQHIAKQAYVDFEKSLD